jgi:hypothetical protein
VLKAEERNILLTEINDTHDSSEQSLRHNLPLQYSFATFYLHQDMSPLLLFFWSKWSACAALGLCRKNVAATINSVLFSLSLSFFLLIHLLTFFPEGVDLRFSNYAYVPWVKFVGHSKGGF